MPDEWSNEEFRQILVPGPTPPGAQPEPVPPAPGAAVSASLDYATLPGWIVFEHFGAAPETLDDDHGYGASRYMDDPRRRDRPA